MSDGCPSWAGRRARRRSATCRTPKGTPPSSAGCSPRAAGRDIDRAATGAGPHLDDLALIDADRDLRHYGSQGEQRRALLALILAEADLLGEERSEQPLLLLDDVTSELDQQRRERLLEAVASFQQTVVTTADEADLGGRAQTVLRVAGGQVTR